MYAITHFDMNQKRSVVIQDGQACIFKTKDLAKRYQVDTLVPKIMELVESGEPDGKTLFGKIKYRQITQEDKRRIKRMLETLMIEPVTKVTFGKSR